MYQMQTPLQQAIVSFVNDFCAFIHHIPFCASFYIFVIVSKAFRNELKRMIYKICGKDLAQIREEQNKQENVENNNLELNVVVVSNIVS